MNTIKRDVYVLRNAIKIPIEVTKGTDMIPIELNVVDYNIPDYAIAVAYALGQTSDVPKKILCDVGNNAIKFTPSESFFEVGRNELMVRVLKDEKKLFTFCDTVICKDSTIKINDASEAQDPSLVEQLLNKMSNEIKDRLVLRSEVEDIREGYNETVYASAGEAVRRQFTNVDSALAKCMTVDNENTVNVSSTDTIVDLVNKIPSFKSELTVFANDDTTYGREFREELNKDCNCNFYGYVTMHWTFDGQSVSFVAIEYNTGKSYRKMYSKINGQTWSKWVQISEPQSASYTPLLLTGDGREIGQDKNGGYAIGHYVQIGNIVLLYFQVKTKIIESGELAKVSLPISATPISGGATFAVSECGGLTNKSAGRGEIREDGMISLLSEDEGNGNIGYSNVEWQNKDEIGYLKMSGFYFV